VLLILVDEDDFAKGIKSIADPKKHPGAFFSIPDE